MVIDGRAGENVDMKAHFITGTKNCQAGGKSGQNAESMVTRNNQDEVNKRVAVLSYRNNKMYLYGEVDENGDIVNQYQYINLTVEALSDQCEGRITCHTEQIKPPKKTKPTTNKNILLRHGGVNLATRGQTIDGNDITLKKSRSALSMYSGLNVDKEGRPR